MTLRTKEEYLATALKNQPDDESPLNLTEDGPLMTQIHPKVILARFDFENSQEMPTLPEIPGWFYATFSSLQKARAAHPQIKEVFTGRVWAVSKFLNESRVTAIIDFPGLGAAVISKEKLEITPSREIHNFVVPPWLSYALSTEMWGPQGKWNRFHTRLHELFQGKDLLENQDYAGYYPLSKKAEKLAQLGFQGTSLDKTYLLVLPWTFSLSALKKLEKVVLEEF